MTEPVIETEALRKVFGEQVAVDALSVTIRRGEVFGFLGPNGAGKTTSLKLLLGLIEPSGGRGTVLGTPLGRREARARIGFLPEHFRFHDCLTARELLRFRGRLFGLRGPPLETRIEGLLTRVDLADAADRQVRTFSKGMLQRAGLAQALVNEPDLVFLDEPTSGLDPLGRVLVRGIIDDLRARGTTVFLNSHLLGEVEATCDRVVFVKQGRVIRELSLAERPTGVDVELKIDRTDALTLTGLAAFGAVQSDADGSVRLRLADERAAADVARWVVERGIALYELRVVRKSLEEWFLEIMGDEQRPG
jgi:ABC-2 type transport system ATP-binding protein